MKAAGYEQFCIPRIVSVLAVEGEVPKLVVTGPLADAEIHLLGAHVSHFQPRGERPLLWMSPKSPFAEGKGIRGGVPLCWPWFGPHAAGGERPTHGFVRTRFWQPESSELLPDGAVRIVLGYQPEGMVAAWGPESCRLRATITVGTALDVELRVENTGGRSWTSEFCFHTYFLVGDAVRATVEGFDGVPCLDRHLGDREGVQRGPITFAGEVTKILDAPQAECRLIDPVLGRTIVAAKRNAAQTVVWNPGAEKAAAMKEIAEHWPEFVCVEAANCRGRAVDLAPGGSFTMGVSYHIEH